MSLDNIQKIFYGIVEDAKNGFSMNVCGSDFDYVRFNYIENGVIKTDSSEDGYYGFDDAYNEEYEAEYSNGTVNYLPTLVVNNKTEFFEYLELLVKKYYDFYKLDNLVKFFDEDSVIKNIILTIFSNARYYDYENPVAYFKRYINYFSNPLDDEGMIENIEILDNCSIEYKNSKEIYGYETPYSFKMVITNGNDVYNLPVINYGISDDTCYIYSVQNKDKNDDNVFCKRIKRLLNKVNANVNDDSDYEKSDTILGVTPSFVLTMALFLKELKNNGIDNVRVITFLPDRYFEKKATEEYDADIIEHNLTEKMVLLFYRLKYHISGIDINYPIYDGIIPDNEVGDDLVVKLGDSITCDNNELLKSVLKKDGKTL